MDEGVDLVVFLAQDLGVIGVGADPLDAEEQGVLQGEDVRVRRGVGFQAHRLGLLQHGFLVGSRRKGGRARGEIGLAARGLDLGLQTVPQLHALLDEFNEPLGVEVHVGQGGKRRLDGKDIDLPVADADLAPRHRHLGQPLQAVDQQVLQGRHFGVLAAYPLNGAPHALRRLFTLIAKHLVPPKYWIIF